MNEPVIDRYSPLRGAGLVLMLVMCVAAAMAGSSSPAYAACYGAGCNDRPAYECPDGGYAPAVAESRIDTLGNGGSNGYVALRRTGCYSFLAEVAGIGYHDHVVYMDDFGAIQPNGAPYQRGNVQYAGAGNLTHQSNMWSGTPMRACVYIASGPAAGFQCTSTQNI